MKLPSRCQPGWKSAEGLRGAGGCIALGQRPRSVTRSPFCRLLQYTHTLQCYTPSFPEYPVAYTGQPCSVWKGTTQEHEYQEVKIRGPQWASLLTCLLFYRRLWVSSQIQYSKVCCEHPKVNSCSSNGFMLSGPACGVLLGAQLQQCPRMTPSEKKNLTLPRCWKFVICTCCLQGTMGRKHEPCS